MPVVIPDLYSAHVEALAREIEQVIEAGVREGVEKAIREGLHDALGKLAVTIQQAWEQERFSRLAAEWKKDTFLLSKTSAKVLHVAYQKIIGMGPAAVPCILKDLSDDGPNHWFWALHAITEENPVPADQVGNIAAMTEAWLQWGRQKGYLSNSQTLTGPKYGSVMCFMKREIDGVADEETKAGRG